MSDHYVEHPCIIQEFLANNNNTPPALIPYPAPRVEVEVRRAVERVEPISFRLPWVWLEEIDRLVTRKYKTRSELVREAIRQPLEEHDRLRV